MTQPRFLISAAHKSSGKTVVSAGLSRAFTQQNQNVGSFKKGPDYIDPLWLSSASGNPCYNLDFNTMGHDELLWLFTSRAAGRDLSIIEANKGLFDGINPDGSDSNAQLAKLLKTPVILVVDTVGMTRGVAPLLLGYQGFDPDIEIAGVILNKTGGPRHTGKLVQAVESYTDIPVLGAIRRTPDMDIAERHLGLITPAENAETDQWLDLVSYLVKEQVDLDRVLEISQHTETLNAPSGIELEAPNAQGLSIGIARDEAFGFYYADDLEAFEKAGVSLTPIDMTRDTSLPEIDGLFIGGGFPETQMAALSANTSMLASVQEKLSNGLPCYAECGGFMYLCKSLKYNDKQSDLAGFFDAHTAMQTKPQGRGYVRFNRNENHPWGASGDLNAHEFHYARVTETTERTSCRDIKRGHGTDGKHDGYFRNNTLAGFIHQRHTVRNPWVHDFLRFAQRCKLA